MIGEPERSRSPGGRKLGRRTARRISVVCLPGAGGPALFEELRQLTEPHGDCRVRLVAPTPHGTASPMLIGDPLSGVLWPCAFPGDSPDTMDDARRRLRTLWWLVWEMGMDAECEVSDATAASLLATEWSDHRADAIVVAASKARRWRGTIRDLTRRARRSSIELRVARDARL